MALMRWDDFKKYTFITVMLLLIATPIIAVTPLGPGTVKSYIEKKNPPGEPVSPWATEWMYKLGRFYSFTLRDESAMKTYDELFEWYFDPDREVPEDDPWVGMALYHEGMILADTSHQRQATERLVKFLDRWGDNPEISAEVIRTARNFVATSKFKPR